MGATAYPLQWPDSFPRTPSREAGKFKTTLAAALGNVTTSLSRFGTDSGKKVGDVVISSNIALGTGNRPDDPGIAVWFTWDETSVCIPVDRYSTPEANLQAIHHVIEARRTEIRHGTLALVRATMRGFTALPAPAGEEPWHHVLNLPPDATKAAIEASYKDRCRRAHPDSPGGSVAAMCRLNVARDKALRGLRA